MKLETFFEKFDQFANAPNTVAKMRELVLYLSVRGQLAPQNSEDEPASSALKKIFSSKDARKTDKVLENDNLIGAPFPVPASWKWVHFGDIVRIRTGKLDANAAVDGGV